MDRDTAVALNRRLLANLQARETDLAEGEMQLQASDFFSEGLYASEVRHLFYGTAQPVAFSAEVNFPGSYLALEVLDLPVLLSRDQAGRLHAFINACSHRGAQIATGSGQRERHSCPFHGWTFSAAGNLLGRPAADSFSTQAIDLGLTALPVSERAGIIVIGMSSDVPQIELDRALNGFEDELTQFGFAGCQVLDRRQYEVAANWKLVTDLSLESYHFNVLHRNSVAEVLAHNAIVDCAGNNSRWAFPFKTIVRLGDLDEVDWPDAVEGSVTYTLFPSVMLIANASGVQMIRAEPGSRPDRARVSYVGLASSDVDSDIAMQSYEFGGDVFVNEDLPMAEQCQRGIRATGRPLIIGRNEPLLQFWHRQWHQFIASKKG